MNRTRIEYLDFTWNPLVGCSGVRCAVAGACWARGQAKRQKPQYEVTHGGEVKLIRGCPDCYGFKPPYPNKWNVKRMHKCKKCGAPHRRRASNVNPDLCSSCAKGLSQAKHRERKAVRGLGRLEVGGV